MKFKVVKTVVNTINFYPLQLPVPYILHWRRMLLFFCDVGQYRFLMMPCLSITSQLSCCFLLFYLNCLLPTAKNKMTTTSSSSSRDDDGKWKRMNGTNPNPSINFVCTQHTTFMPSCISLPLYLILPAVPFPLIAIFTSKRLASFFQ